MSNQPDSLDKEVGIQDQHRRRLLARMAGNIACGVISGMFYRKAPDGNGIVHLDADEVADVSVATAEKILGKLGL